MCGKQVGEADELLGEEALGRINGGCRVEGRNGWSRDPNRSDILVRSVLDYKELDIKKVLSDLLLIHVHVEESYSRRFGKGARYNNSKTSLKEGD